MGKKRGKESDNEEEGIIKLEEGWEGKLRRDVWR
jgi:hypothetical protein